MSVIPEWDDEKNEEIEAITVLKMGITRHEFIPNEQKHLQFQK